MALREDRPLIKVKALQTAAPKQKPMETKTKKWVWALRLQTAKRLKTLTEVVAGKQFYKDYIKYLREELEKADD